MQVQSVDLWEAWIDPQVIGTAARTILYVVGEVYINKEQKPVLVKRTVQPESDSLHLEIINQGSVGETDEIYYSEVVDYCLYQEVVIYNSNEVVTRIEVENRDNCND